MHEIPFFLGRCGVAELSNNVLDCALCLEGGGYRGAYTAGILSVLLEHGIYFDYVCGISAGSSNAVNYLSRDLTRMHFAFVGVAGDRQAGGTRSFFRRRGYFNADYLYEGCLNDPRAPFDFEAFQANPARIAIQSFERDTGKTVVFRREDLQTPDDMIKRVRASSTLPWLMHPIEVNGQTMLDGALGRDGGIPLYLAEKDGFERFFCIATRPKGYRKSKSDLRGQRVIKRISENYPYMRDALLTRWERYNAALDHLEEAERQGTALVVRPETMTVHGTTQDPDKLQALYDQARRQAERELPVWKAFLGMKAPTAYGSESVMG
jgi:predicted patatin/cPLA2 family phospholipase